MTDIQTSLTLIDASDDRHNDGIRWDSDELEVALDIALVGGGATGEQRMIHAEGEEEAGADGVVVGSREILAEERLYLVPERRFQTCLCTNCSLHHL